MATATDSDVTVVAATPADQETVNDLCVADRSRKLVMWDVLPSRFLTNVKVTQGRTFFVVKNGQQVAFFMLRTEKDSGMVTLSDVRTLAEYKERLPWAGLVKLALREDAGLPKGVVILENREQRLTGHGQEWIQLRASMYRFGKDGSNIINQALNANSRAMQIYKALVQTEAFSMTVKIGRKSPDRDHLFGGQPVLVNTSIYEVYKDCVNAISKLYENRYMSFSGSPEVALSFGSRLPLFASVGWVYDMSYYGNTDLDSLLAHICKHMEHAFQEPIRTDVFCKVTLPSKFMDKFGESQLQAFCGKIFKAHPNNVKVDFIVKESLELSPSKL